MSHEQVPTHRVVEEKGLLANDCHLAPQRKQAVLADVVGKREITLEHLSRDRFGAHVFLFHPRMGGGKHIEGVVQKIAQGLRVLDLVERFDLLVPESVPSPVEQLKLLGRKRQRASAKRVTTASQKKWQWGDEP